MIWEILESVLIRYITSAITKRKVSVRFVSYYEVLAQSPYNVLCAYIRNKLVILVGWSVANLIFKRKLVMLDFRANLFCFCVNIKYKSFSANIGNVDGIGSALFIVGGFILHLFP